MASAMVTQPVIFWFTLYIAAAIESKGEGLVISLDMAKAFDRVWHGALLVKLPPFGLP